MARNFTSASSQYLNGTAPVSSQPCTLACWFYSSSTTANQTLINLSIGATAGRYIGIAADGSAAGDPVNLFINDGAGNVNCVSTTGFTANTWFHACGVVASATDRRSFINGGSKGTSATSRNPTGLDSINVAAFKNGGGARSAFMSGRIAVPCIWNVALSDDDVAMLAAGYHPSLIRPDAIVSLWELDQDASPEPDTWGGLNLTLGGSPTLAEDAPIIYPTGVMRVAQSAASPPAAGSNGVIGGGVGNILIAA